MPGHRRNRQSLEHVSEGELAAAALSDGSELLMDAEFAAHYEDAAVRSALLRELIAVRTSGSLTQDAIAQKMGTTQSAVSELESGATDPRLSTLQRYARAVDRCCIVQLATATGTEQFAGFAGEFTVRFAGVVRSQAGISTGPYFGGLDDLAWKTLLTPHLSAGFSLARIAS